MEKAYLGAIRAAIPRHVTHDLRQVLGVLDDKHVSEHLEVVKVGSDVGNLEW